MHYGAVTLEPGVVLAGKYRIERILGQGGMGVVAAAYHVHLEQRVALKLMLPHAMGSAESVSRFLREARAAARITSEHVARVFDVGTLESGAPYIAMEYLEGCDLSQLMHARGRLPVNEVIEYILQACEALAEAHKVGIVHRDLKPANLYLAQRIDGQQLIKVLDFGISKMSGASAQSDAPATRTSALMGSPLYMSPEQMGSSRAVDARSDIWALGVVLHEMLSGAPPFDGDTLPQVCARVMSEPPPPLREQVPGLPPPLYDVVDRCLQKQAAARFQTVAELAFALEPLASPRARQSIERIARVLGVTPSAGISPGQLPVTATTADPALHGGTQATWGDTRPKPPERGKAPLIIGVLAALGVASAGGWLMLRTPALSVHMEPAASAHGPLEPASLPTAPPPPLALPPAPAPSPVEIAAPNASAAPAEKTAAAAVGHLAAVTHHASKPSAEPASKPAPAAAASPVQPVPASAPPTPTPTVRSRL